MIQMRNEIIMNSIQYFLYFDNLLFTEQQPHFLFLQLIFAFYRLIVIVMYFQRECICTIY